MGVWEWKGVGVAEQREVSIWVQVEKLGSWPEPKGATEGSGRGSVRQSWEKAWEEQRPVRCPRLPNLLAPGTASLLLCEAQNWAWCRVSKS